VLLALGVGGAEGADDRVDRGAEDGGAEERGDGVRDEVREVPGEIVIAVVARVGEERGGGGERDRSESETAGGFHRREV